MIMTIIEIFFGLVNSIISTLPVLNVPQGLIDGTNDFINMLNSLNMLFPVTTLMVCLGAIMTYHAFTMSFYLINWVIRKIPTIS